MNIALIIPSLNPGGAERVLSDLANYWQSKGYHVTLITLASPESEPFYPLSSKISLIQLDQSHPEACSVFKRLGHILRRVFCLRITLKRLAPDVIFSFVDVMNLTTLLASLGLKIPVIVSERTHPAYYKLPSLYQKMREFLYPRAFKVVIQTASAAEYFKKLSNGLIIANAVWEPSCKKNTVSERIHHIVSVGRLCPFKGFDTLIQAFARLHPKYPTLRLIIYGEGAERENLQNLINSLNLQEKISLPGTTQNIHQKLVASDLFVFPSLYEGFPNALCEAMAVGLPVIASKCSGNIDIVRDGIDGRLFPIGDVDALAILMEALMHNPQHRQRLGEQAKTISTRFHPDRIFHLWDTLLLQASKKP